MKVTTATKETILVAYDEEPIRDLLQQYLENDGYRVLVAADGPQAIALSRDYQGPIHLLMTDMMMPGIDGSLLASRLTDSRSDMKVLYVSGYTPSSTVHHSVTATGTAFLPKPFSQETLLRTIRRVLDTK